MKVAMLLADFAEVVNGKLYIMGAGWSITGPNPVPSAIAVKVEIPWDQAKNRHTLRLKLVDANGQTVIAPMVDGSSRPVELAASFEDVGKAQALVEGSPLDVPFAVNLPPLPLEPGKRYVWKLSVDDQSQDDWQVPFTTRPSVVKDAGTVST